VAARAETFYVTQLADGDEVCQKKGCLREEVTFADLAKIFPGTPEVSRAISIPLLSHAGDGGYRRFDRTRLEMDGNRGNMWELEYLTNHDCMGQVNWLKSSGAILGRIPGSKPANHRFVDCP